MTSPQSYHVNTPDEIVFNYQQSQLAFLRHFDTSGRVDRQLRTAAWLRANDVEHLASVAA